VSEGKQKERIEDLFKLLTGPDVRTILDKYYNRQACKCTVVKADIYAQLIKQWKDKNDDEPNATVTGMFNDITADVMTAWSSKLPKGNSEAPISSPGGSGKSTIKTLTNTDSKKVFHIAVGTGKKRKSKAGKAVNEEELSNNFQIFQRINADIWSSVINNKKYEKLFQGYTRNFDAAKGETSAPGGEKTGDLRQLIDIGHVEAVGSKGKGELAVGIINGMLDMDNITKEEKAELRTVRDTLLSLEIGIKTTWVFNKDSGVLSYTEEQDYVLEAASTNRGANKAVETPAQKELSAALSKLAESKTLTAKILAEREGSPSMMDMIGDMIVNTPLKKAAYKNKSAINNTKYKKPIPTPKGGRTTKSKKMLDSRAGSASFSITPKMAKKTPRPKKEDKEKGNTVNPEQFANTVAASLKIKNAINKRLPAEVRRNMGRPALNNITGRFSNSALIESITPAAATLLVKYTYRLDPYETFENTGRRKWPRGYNPKPLISKSIRGLALSMFKIAKLTTRRV